MSKSYTAVFDRLIINFVFKLVAKKRKKIPYRQNNSKIINQSHRKRLSDTPNTQIHDHSPSSLGKCTSIKRCGIKLVVWAQTCSLNEMMRSCKRFPHVSKMLTLTYNWTNIIIVKNVIILNIIHTIT
jgi:hypothetical protein